MCPETKRKWRPSNVEVPDRVIEAGLHQTAGELSHEKLRLIFQAALQEWAGDRPQWSMNVSAETHVVWLERRVDELETVQSKIRDLAEELHEQAS